MCIVFGETTVVVPLLISSSLSGNGRVGVYLSKMLRQESLLSMRRSPGGAAEQLVGPGSTSVRGHHTRAYTARKSPAW